MSRSSSYRVLRQIAHGSKRGGVYPRFTQQHRSCLQYAFSTSTLCSAPRVPIEPILYPAAPPTPPRSRSMRYLRTIITVGVFFLIGSAVGRDIVRILVPPPLPIPDSEEDIALLADLRKDLASMHMVEILSSPTAEEVELVEYEALMDLPEEIRDQNMSVGALRGARGIAFRRMFWHADTGLLVGFVFLGGGLTGWPGVIHGGIVATLLMEAIETVGNGGPQEIRGLISTTEGQDVEDGMVREFDISYFNPTKTNRVFVITAKYSQDPEDNTILSTLSELLPGGVKLTARASGKVRRERIIHTGDDSQAPSEFFSEVN